MASSHPDESLSFLLFGMVFLLPLILAYTAYSYWIFRGKIRQTDGYGAFRLTIERIDTMENKSGGKVINHGGILKRLSWFIGL